MLLEIFAMAKSLHNLNDLSGLSEIPSGSFNELSIFKLDLSEFPELRKIGFSCFKGLFSMQELRLPPNINEILSGSLSNCLRLESLDLSNCTSLENIGFDTFKDAHSLREIIFPVNSKIKTIHSGAFLNCTSLVTLDLSNCLKLEQISFDTFVNAWSLQEIIFGPNVKEIMTGAFRNLTSLTRLRIPASIEKISWNTFEGCVQLEEVIFEGDTVVDPDAFQNCPRLERRVFPRKKIPGCLYGKYSELKASLQFGQGESGATCGISLEEFQEDSDIVVLPCGHAYLEEAFHEWFSRQKKCATCKREFW